MLRRLEPLNPNLPTFMKTIFTFLAGLLLLPGVASALRISYSYDAAGRLTAANYNGDSRTAYGYDKNGSLTSRVRSLTPVLAASPHLAGTYSGLITNATPNAGNTGVITLKLLANGTFSGRLTIQGGSFAFAGKFDANGLLEPLHIQIDRKAPLLDYLLSLTLDVQSSPQAIQGTITGDFNSEVFNSNIAMRPDRFNLGGLLMGGGMAGKFTMIFEADNGPPGVPEGTGFATVAVSTKGVVTLAGKLPNNVAITQGGQILWPNVWPLYVPLHAQLGFLAGTMTFVNLGPVVLQGDIHWLKPATAGTFHPAAFSTSVLAEGARYLPPASGQRVLDFLPVSPNAVFEAFEGNLAAPWSKNVTLDSANKFIIPLDASVLKLGVATASGLVTGTFKSSPTTTRVLSGVVMQGERFAAGFFVGDTESGDFSVEPLP